MSVYTTCCRPQVCVLSAVQVCVRCVSPKQCCTKLILWYEGVGVFCSVTVLLRHSHLLFYFILGRAICCLIRSLNLCCFLLAILIKNIIFSCFIIILADLFLKLQAVIFILLFKIYLFCNFWEALECKGKQKAWEKCFADCSGGSSNSPDNTHAHTHTSTKVLIFVSCYLS